jgi:arylsulfatase A-like enzyme
VILSTDHGFYLGEHGCIGKSLLRGDVFQYFPPYTEVARIPLLVYFPGCQGGSRVQALCQPVDLMPTVLDLLGVPKPASVESLSLLPVLEGRATKVKEIAIASPTLFYENAPSTLLSFKGPDPAARSSITDGEWLLVYGARPEKAGGVSRTAAVDSRIREVRNLQGEIRPELYHLARDPGCEKNLFSENRAQAESLHTAYWDFLKAKKIPENHLQYFRVL